MKPTAKTAEPFKKVLPFLHWDTLEEATNRKKQIEHELVAGTFLIPSTVTVAEFLMDWLPKQCSKHKWAPKTYESNLSTIQNLIIPYIGSMEMQKLKPYHMENLYTTLSKTPCGSYTMTVECCSVCLTVWRWSLC